MEFNLVNALIVSVVINLFVFLFAFKKQTDHYTDITYSSCFALLVIWGYAVSDQHTFQTVLVFMIVLWALRLGSYLMMRIQKIGVDHRFDEMRPVFSRYIKFWILQAGSIWIVAIPFIIGFTKTDVSTGYFQGIGFALWIFGWLLETVADYQKFSFKNDTKNKGKFIQSGVWSRIRHPNYLGEMLLWIGVFVYVSPVLSGIEYLSIFSPMWICFLLVFVSGIPYLERGNHEKYGDTEDYKGYLKRTSRLIPGVY